MKKHILTAAAILAVAGLAKAQTTAPSPIEKETWDANPKIHTIDAKHSKESAVILLDTRRVEYADENKDEVAQYYTVHKLIHVNDDRGIENFNKIYLGFNEKADIVDIKARAILPDGKVTTLDQNNIKEIKDEDGTPYKIFAMDGLVKGAEVEYFYTFKRPVNFFGRENIQGPFPVLKANFQLYAPARLKFDSKVFNGTGAPVDTVLGTKRAFKYSFANIPGVDDEKYAFYAANLERIEYKLSYNDAGKVGERLFSWNEFAKRVHGNYSYYTDKDVKKIQAMITANGWDKITSDEKKVIAVENYIKKTFSVSDDMKDVENNALTTVLQNKTAGDVGTMRLYGAIFQNLGMKFQYVLTGDRSKQIIDKQFENWNNCDNAMIYFPTLGKFIAPSRPDFRYPFINPLWGATDGVFLKATSIGNFTTAIAEVKNIDLEDHTRSFSNIESHLELTPGLDSLTIDAKQIFGGYMAVTYRDAFNFANEEQRRNITKEMIRSVASTDHILSSNVLNKEFDDNNKPLILQSKTRSAELIERAGGKLLLKIGMAIGPQVEMYQEKERQNPVNIECGQVQERKLEFVIPAGYTISNLNDLKMSEVHTEDGQPTMGFTSTYEVKGNILSIHIMEEYRKTFYPLSQFAQYRKIINQSSDFNKVVLVLEKKG